MIENPFRTVPPERYIQISTSFCQPDGNSDNAHDDTIYFNREISAALLYTILKRHMSHYEKDSHYEIQETKQKLTNPIQILEEWLEQQKALYKTTGPNEETIEDTGLTIADYKTSFGSIDIFIEYGISYKEKA